MRLPRSIARATLLALGLSLLLGGCVIEPREGFYDHDHHRWYHEHHWRDCGEHEQHCRD